MLVLNALFHWNPCVPELDLVETHHSEKGCTRIGTRHQLLCVQCNAKHQQQTL